MLYQISSYWRTSIDQQPLNVESNLRRRLIFGNAAAATASISKESPYCEDI